MGITAIVERAVSLDGGRRGGPANAVVDFSRHTVSLVAIITDVLRGAAPVTGVAFDSIGRFAQRGILRDRMIPRVLAAPPEALLDAAGQIDPAAVLACALRDEKPGGHGDRAAAAGALELACWDLNAKLSDEPACMTIARHFRREPAPAVGVYAAGGYYYYPAADHDRLAGEMRGYLDLAPRSFYQLDAAGNPQRPHYDGLPADFTAEAITTLGGHSFAGCRTYNVLNTHDTRRVPGHVRRLARRGGSPD